MPTIDNSTQVIFTLQYSLIPLSIFFSKLVISGEFETLFVLKFEMNRTMFIATEVFANSNRFSLRRHVADS